MLTQIAGFDAAASRHPRRKTYGVNVGHVRVGGNAPIVVQSMTNTDTADIDSTFTQTMELAEAGSEIVRWTVNVPEAAAAVPEIKKRLLAAGCNVPIIGDFHYNGHVLLTKYPGVRRRARQIPHQSRKRRRRPAPRRTVLHHLQNRPRQRQTRPHWRQRRLPESRAGHAQDAGEHRPESRQGHPKRSSTIAWCSSALESTELALESGLRHDQIIISCKTSRPRDLITVYRDLSAKTEQPLHLGLTEAGMGMKGQIWSAAALGVLLHQGIGDTIRISLTPKPGGDRREEVYAACEVLQALGLRSFSPSVTACPGCGRTTSTTFQELAERIQGYIRDMMPIWKTQYEGVETMTLAVMGCIVNGPGESKAANIGISLPGTGEAPRCPVYIDGKKDVTARRHLRRTCRRLPSPGRQLHQHPLPTENRRGRFKVIPATKTWMSGAVLAVIAATGALIGTFWYKRTLKGEARSRQAFQMVSQEIEEENKLASLGDIGIDPSGLTLGKLNDLLRLPAHRLSSAPNSSRVGWACGGELCAVTAAFAIPNGMDLPPSAEPILLYVTDIGFGKPFQGSIGGIHLGDPPDVILNVCRQRGYGAARENHRITWDKNWEISWTRSDHRLDSLTFMNRTVLDGLHTNSKEHSIEN